MFATGVALVRLHRMPFQTGQRRYPMPGETCTITLSRQGAWPIPAMPADSFASDKNSLPIRPWINRQRCMSYLSPSRMSSNAPNPQLKIPCLPRPSTDQLVSPCSALEGK